MKHPTYIEDYGGTLQELAQDIGNLRYDILLEFLNHLSDDLRKQYLNDLYNKRTKLATCLSLAEKNIKVAALYVEDAWRISKPYMENTIISKKDTK